jgi:hypothetical protein
LVTVYRSLQYMSRLVWASLKPPNV